MQMDQFFFMADRHDSNFCCVRYITNIQLREWKRYLQPLASRKWSAHQCLLQNCVDNVSSVKQCQQLPIAHSKQSMGVAFALFASTYRQKASFTSRHVSYTSHMLCAGYMNKVPEEAMGNLQKCLNVAHSPIFSADFEQIYRQELRANGSKSSSTSSSRANSRGGTTSSRSGTTSSSSRNGTTKSPSGGWLRDLFSSSKRDDSATSSSNGARDVDVLVLDPMGYYSLLGLKPGNQVSNLM